jgi:hypothetical protein
VKYILINIFIIVTFLPACSTVHYGLQQVAKSHNCNNIPNPEERRACEQSYSKDFNEVQNRWKE